MRISDPVPRRGLAIAGVLVFVAFGIAARAFAPADFDARAAARYLDSRVTWWQSWPNARRDHGTSCV